MMECDNVTRVMKCVHRIPPTGRVRSSMKGAALSRGLPHTFSHYPSRYLLNKILNTKVQYFMAVVPVLCMQKNKTAKRYLNGEKTTAACQNAQSNNYIKITEACRLAFIT